MCKVTVHTLGRGKHYLGMQGENQAFVYRKQLTSLKRTKAAAAHLRAQIDQGRKPKREHWQPVRDREAFNRSLVMSL